MMMDKNMSEKQKTNILLRSLYAHYDSFYTDCLNKLRCGTHDHKDILKDLKIILRFEYMFTKEIDFIEHSEDLSRLIDLIPYIYEPDLLILILRIIAEKVKDTDYTEGWKKHELQWQVKLNKFVQMFFEFFLQTNFESIIETIPEDLKKIIEKSTLVSSYEKIKDLAILQEGFMPMKTLLEEIISNNKELTEDSLKEIYNLFLKGKREVSDIHPDIYQIGAILSLLALTRNYFLKKDNHLLNFLFVTEKLKVSLKSMKTSISLPKLKEGEQKWTQIAFRSLEMLSKQEFQNQISFEYFCVLQDLVPIYKFLLTKNKENEPIYAICAYKTILKHLQNLYRQKSFCMPVDTLLDEALIEFVNTLRNCIFLSYDSYLLEIGQTLAKSLLDFSFVSYAGTTTLNKIIDFCSEILASDERFCSTLIKPSELTSIFQNIFPKIFESFNQRSPSAQNKKFVYVVLAYSVAMLTTNTEDSSTKEFRNNLKNCEFINNLPIYLQKDKTLENLRAHPEIYLQILLFVIEYDDKKSELLTDEKYLALVLEGLKFLQIRDESFALNKITFKIFSVVFDKKIIEKSPQMEKLIEEILFSFFRKSTLDGVPVEELAKHFKLIKNSKELFTNKIKINLITKVLGHYHTRITTAFEQLFSAPNSQENELKKNYEYLFELEKLAADVILGPLRLVQIMLEPLYKKHDPVVREILDYCKSFSKEVLNIMMSPVLLFAPNEYITLNKKVANIFERIPYLSSLAEILDMNFFSRFVDELSIFLTSCVSRPQFRSNNVQNLINHPDFKMGNNEGYQIAATLLGSQIKENILSREEYSLLNIIDLLFNCQKYLFEAKRWQNSASQNTKSLISEIKKFEEQIPLFLDLLIEFVVVKYTNTEGKISQNLEIASKRKILQSWYLFFHHCWLGLIAITILCSSRSLFDTCTKSVFQHLIKASTSLQLSSVIKLHFIASTFSIPKAISSLKEKILNIQIDNSTLAASNFFKTTELNGLMEKIEKLDALSTVNSFVKEILQNQANEDFGYLLADIASFYNFFDQNEELDIDFKKTLDFLNELNILEAKLRSKELLIFAANIKKYINNFVLKQLKKTTSKDYSAHSEIAQLNKEIENLFEQIQTKSEEAFKETPDFLINIFDKLCHQYTEFSHQSEEVLDWAKLNLSDYPIREEIILKTIKAYNHLSNAFCISDSLQTLSKEKKDIFLKNFGKLFERVTYDIRSYLSYSFLQDNAKDNKIFLNNIVSFLLNLNGLTDQNKDLLNVFSQETFFKSLWLTIYNLVLVSQHLSDEIIQSYLIESLLKKNYSNEISWETSTLILLVLDVYSTQSLPPKELIEVNLKMYFSKCGYNKDLNDLLNVDFLKFAIKYLNEDDIYQVIATCFHPSTRSNQDVLCEVEPISLSKLQTAVAEIGIAEGIILNLSKNTKNMLDALISSIVSNYSYTVAHRNKKDQERVKKRLTVEILYHILYILIKNPHMSPYVFMKQIDTKIIRSEGLPDYFPYSKFRREESVLFLDFLLRVVLGCDQIYACLLLDFMRKSGVIAHVIQEKEKTVLIDIQHVILAKLLQLTKDLIDEELSTGRVLANYESIELTKSILALFKLLIMNGKSLQPSLIAKFFKVIVHKFLDWITRVDKKKFGSDEIMTNIFNFEDLLEEQAKCVADGSLLNLRSDHYLKLLKAFEGYNFEQKQDDIMLECCETFDALANKLKFCEKQEGFKDNNNPMEKNGQNQEETKKAKERLYSVLSETPSESGLGFSGYHIGASKVEPFCCPTLDYVKDIQRKLDIEFEECSLHFLRNLEKVDGKYSQLGKNLANPSLNINLKNLTELASQFSIKSELTSLVNRLKTKSPEKSPLKGPSNDINDEKEEMKQGDIESQRLHIDISPQEFLNRIMQIISEQPDIYRDFVNMALNDKLFDKLSNATEIIKAIQLLQEACKKYFKSSDLKEVFLEKILQKENEIDRQVEKDESLEDITFVKNRQLFKKYVQVFMASVPPKKLTLKKVKRYWFKCLGEIKKDVKLKIESVLLQLRRSLCQKNYIEKLSLTAIENLVNFKHQVEKEFFLMTFYDQEPDYFDEETKELAVQAKEEISVIEELIPQNGDDSYFSNFLERYKISLEKEKVRKESIHIKGRDVEDSKKPRANSIEIISQFPAAESNSVLPSITSIDGKPPHKFALTNHVKFCKDNIEYNELMPGKRQLAQGLLEEEPVAPEVYEAFTNYLCCSDKQIEGLVEFLYLDSMGQEIWKEENKMAKLFSMVCINPLNEIKLLDTLFFLLLTPEIYKNNESVEGFPFKIAYGASVLGLRTPNKIYSLFVENSIYFLKYIIKTLSLRFIFIPRETMSHFTIESIQDLKKKYRHHEKIAEMRSTLDLLIALALIREIKQEKSLLVCLDNLIKSVLDKIQKVKARHYSLELNPRHLEYLMQTYGLDEIVKTFQGSPKTFMNVIPSLFEVILSSLKKGIEKANHILIKMKDIATAPKHEIDHLLGPIEKNVEFPDISKAVHITVENYFNFLFRPVYLFWNSKDFQNLDKETFKIIEMSLQNVSRELSQEDVQLFMVSVYEIVDVYARIIGKENLTYETIKSRGAIIKLVEFCVYFYAILEMKHRLDKELSEEEEPHSPLPKLSKMTSRDISEEQKTMQRSFTNIKSEKKFDFDAIFTNFGLKYNKVLSQMCSSNENSVTTGLILLLCERYPFLLNLDTQRNMLKKMYKEYFYKGEWPYRRDTKIDRNRIIESLAERLQGLSRAELAQPMRIGFEGELGIDEANQGGLTRELYTVLTTELFDPEKQLFRLSGNKLAIQPSADSSIVPNHLKLFELAGIVIAKAIIGDVTVDFTFTKPFLKHCLGNFIDLQIHKLLKGRQISISDLEDLDSDLAKNLQWILDHDVTESWLTFTYDTQILGHNITKELIDKGFEIEVNELNKKEYVMKLCEALMTKDIQSQLEAFLKGFRTILPVRFLSHMAPSDLGLLISGTPTIDLNDMMENCKYEYFSEDSDVAKWFWEVVSEFTQEELGCLLYFASGSAKVPVGGFRNRPFVLKLLDHLPHESLPIAHTCYYTLDLPDYPSKDKLREKLLLAIFEGKEGFYIQ